MKKLKSFISFIVILSAFAIVFTGCGGGGDGGGTTTPDTTASILGKWKLTTSNGQDATPWNLTQEFTNTRWQITGGCNTGGTYTLNGNQLVKVIDTWDAGCSYIAGESWTFTITLTSTTLTTYIAQDHDGNSYTNVYSKIPAGGDTTPPTVSSVNPADNATGVAVNSAITATFSEAMNASTITTATFTLKAGASSVSGTVTYSGVTATFTPSSNLAYSTTYTATITTGVKDLAGNAMASNYTWTFTTGALTVTDIDGNVYDMVTIDTQVWMNENLKVTKYRNGDAIGTTTPATLDISGETSPKYQWAYDGDESNAATYGRLYTWYAVTDSRGVCPTGWHVPTDSEWTTLTDYLGGQSVAGGKMKEAGTTHWNTPNTGADNSSGFTALPGGGRDGSGTFYGIGYSGVWWSATEDGAADAWFRYLLYHLGDASRSNDDKYYGFSVRCVRD